MNIGKKRGDVRFLRAGVLQADGSSCCKPAANVAAGQLRGLHRAPGKVGLWSQRLRNLEPLLQGQGQELPFQRREVTFDHVPDCIPVDSEIVVDKDVPHPDDVRPRDTRVCSPEFRRDPPYRFPDDLEVVDRPGSVLAPL